MAIHPQGMRRVLNSCSRELDKAEAALEESNVEKCLVHYEMLAIYLSEAGRLLYKEIREAMSAPYRAGKEDHGV